MWFSINLISLVSAWMSSRHLLLTWAVLSQLPQPWRGKCDGRGVWFVGGGLFEPEGANWDMMFPPSKVDWKTMRWSICDSIMFFKERRWLRWVLSSSLMVGDVSHKEASIFLYKENRESKCWEDLLCGGCSCGKKWRKLESPFGLLKFLKTGWKTKEGWHMWPWSCGKIEGLAYR